MEYNMNKEQIKAVTDTAKQPCLIGMRGFDHDIQQFTCKCFNGVHCDCYNKYKFKLTEYENSIGINEEV